MKPESHDRKIQMKQVGTHQGFTLYGRVKCPYCLGKGHMGRSSVTGRLIPCRCVVVIRHGRFMRALRKEKLNNG